MLLCLLTISSVWRCFSIAEPRALGATIFLIAPVFKKVWSKEDDGMVYIDILSLILLARELLAWSEGDTYSLYPQTSQV